MFSNVYFVFLAVFIAVCTAKDGANYGDACTLQRSGEAGVCRNLRDCVSAKEDFRRGSTPQNCGYSGTIPIVCCVAETAETPPTPPPSTPLSSPKIVTSRPGSTECPDLPPGAVTATKTGQKAWDYCINLSEAIYPCTTKGDIFNSTKIRSSECGHISTPLTMGGSYVTAGEFPHMALLGFSNDPIEWDCSGTLISKDWVMTAAHCILKRNTGNVSHILLGGGDTNNTLEAEYYYRVAEIIPHPEFNTPNVYNDIALLRTDRSVTFTSKVLPACLHTGNSVKDEKIIITGWGATFPRESKNRAIQKATLEKFSYQDCSAKNRPTRRFRDGLTDATQFCAGHYTELPCQGNSGSPIQIYNDAAVECTYLVLGVASFAKACGVPGQPAIFTRVSAFIPWIEDIVWPNGL